MAKARTLQQQFEAFLPIYITKIVNEIALNVYEKNKKFCINYKLWLKSTHQRIQTEKFIEDVSNNTNRSTEDVSNCSHHNPRFSKLEFPRHNGVRDPLSWLNRCEHFFRHQRISYSEKLSLITIHLEDDAQLCFMKLTKDQPHLTCEEFQTKCHLRFRPSIHCKKLGASAKLRQTGSVEDYQRKFEQLSARASSLTSEQEIEIFLSGLHEYIAVEVELHKSTDLTSVMQ
ncbi:hypothetical protein QQ045_030832 [Rhodiola kirilowii]